MIFGTVSQFRRGRMLQVSSAKQVFSFSLDGTSALLPALLNCVRQETTPPGGTNPFAAQQATAKRAGPSRGALQAEAAIIGANVLGAAGIKGFSLGSAEDATKFGADAVWTSDKLVGSIKIAEFSALGQFQVIRAKKLRKPTSGLRNAVFKVVR